MGEHSVVYGEPAIALPFYATQIVVTIEPAKESLIDSSYFSGKLQEAPASLSNLQQLIKKLQDFFLDLAGVKITIESTIPPERGMGSSAAVAVALTRSYFDYKDVPLSDVQLLSFVNFSEKIAHGNPSGIDAAATSGTSPLYFIKGQTMDAFPLNLDAYLVVADTGIKGQTRAAVADVAKLMQTDETKYLKLTALLGVLTEEARNAIINNNALHLGKLMDRAHHCLQHLTVSNDTLDHLADTAITNGALGAKLTGGGRGGCLIALAEDRKAAEKIATALEQQGAVKVWIQKLGVNE